MTTFYPFGAGTYTLSGSISSTATSIILSSFLEPVTDTPYTMALINSDIAFGTISPKTTSAEFISFTGITQNADGTATLTGVTRGLAKKYPFTTSSSYKLPHSGQSQFIISDLPQLFQEYIPLNNDVTVPGVKTFTSFPITPSSAPTTDYQVANKKYVDDIAIAGSPKATDTVYGISKLSVAAADPLIPIVVGTNDLRMAPTTGTSGGIMGWTSTTVRASSVLLTNHALIVGGGAGATPTPVASLGTTTTLLHGNASGDPTWAAVSLTADVSGILPKANGGTGVSTGASMPIAVRTSQLAVGSGSTTETDIIANTSLPGGSLAANRAIRYECYFTYTGAATAQISFKVYFGGTAVGTMAFTGNSGTEAMTGHFVITVAYVGASSQYVSGVGIATNTTTTSGAGTTFPAGVTTTSAIDESTAQNVKMTVQGVNNGSTLTVETVQGATIHLI